MSYPLISPAPQISQRPDLQALEEYRTRTYEDSLIIEEGATLCKRFDAKTAFTYKCQLSMSPEMAWKGNYKDIKVGHPHH